MSGNTQSPWFFLGAAVVGIVSAASMFIVEHYRQERRRHKMAQNLANLDQQMAVMRKELEQLRSLQKSKSSARKRRTASNRSASVLSTTTTDDYTSALDADSSDLEFYDLSDEEVSKSNSSDYLQDRLIEIDRLLDGANLSDVERAIEKLDEMCIEHPENVELLWRLGKGHHKLADGAKDDDTKRTNIQKGVDACTAALNLNPDSVEAHKWLAILIGCRSDLQPLKERITDGYLFKKHVDAAIALNPSDASLHHMLGRFAYEIAGLKWYERKAASTFFTEPPTATYEDALRHFTEAENLIDHEWKENKLLLAKCLIALGDYTGAVKHLRAADSIENDQNTKVDGEVKALLDKYNSYR